jgi:hypothetical protein
LEPENPVWEEVSLALNKITLKKILLTGTYYHTGGMYSQLEYSEIGITLVWMPMSEPITMGKAKL